MDEPFRNWAISRGAVLSGDTILHFGDPAMEYHAARSGVALFDRSDRGRLRISGAQALDLLHRTTTQDLKGLAPGRGALTVIQTETARILDWVTLWIREDDIVALTGSDRAMADLEWIDRMVIMDDVAAEDMTSRTALFEMVGPGAPEVVKALAPAAAGMEAGDNSVFEWRGIAGFVARGREKAIPSFWMLVQDRDRIGAIRALEEAGPVRPAGELASESIRIETGQPLPGRELTEATNPLEAGLNDSIGFRKGCYTGQEVIARMVTYKSVKRTLAGFLFEGEVVAPEFRRDYPVIAAPDPETGLDVEADTNPLHGDDAHGDSAGPNPATAVGRVTSAAFCYGPGQHAGLGIVALEFSSPGTRVIVETTRGAVAARIAALPLRPD